MYRRQDKTFLASQPQKLRPHPPPRQHRDKYMPHLRLSSSVSPACGDSTTLVFWAVVQPMRGAQWQPALSITYAVSTSLLVRSPPPPSCEFCFSLSIEQTTQGLEYASVSGVEPMDRVSQVCEEALDN